MEIITEKSKYKFFREAGYLLNKELYKEFKRFFKSRIERDEKAIIKKLREIPGDEEIIRNLCNVNAVGFGITEECNFRCEYCIYSGKYPDERTHKNIKLDKKTTFKALEFLLEFISNPLRNVNSNYLDIGFYGGEPLLEIDLIKEVVPYANKLIRKFFPRNNLKNRFRITTNGYLLDKNIIDFCARSDVLLDISLDGPEEEHDRFRLLKDGSPTWQRIFDNIKYIKKNYPGFYKDHVSFQPTIHPLHNEQSILAFYKKNTSFFDYENIRFGRVNLRNVKPAMRQKWLKQGSTVSKYLLNKRIKENIEDKFYLKNLYEQKKLTASCFPGGLKVFVDARGNFHMCERINPHFPIGNVDQGFDFDVIRSLIKQYNEELIRLKCWQCDFWSLCPVCHAHAARGDKIEIDCELTRKDLQLLLKHDLKNKEQEDEKKMGSSPTTISDYIEQL